ncbi:RUS1 family protein C16orf58-like protein [Trichoplax sp. H2]|nr:RUS1 family protein C16orf58-like protein [Trichoplax sp. H2]|eukprot:RDD42977.1 RUS1 family protein C16orf58-like protein [Trichoplax sp. H2]
MSATDYKRVRIQEFYGSSESRTYSLTSSKNGTKINVIKSTTPPTSVQFFKSVFLPQGYPESVSGDYLTYQLWDTLQAFCSSITGTLATQAILKGVGVGDEKATVAAAAMTWMLKDGTGMIGRILFAWLRGLFADFLNDGALFIEMIAPNFPHLFTLLLCVASVAKSIVGVAGGATRAALTMHQARRNNMADVSAKDGSQETLVNLSALIVGLFLLPAVTGNARIIWTLFFMFTMLHLYANYKAVSSVVMETLNRERLHILAYNFFRYGSILSPAEVCQRESVIIMKDQYKLRMILGAEFIKESISSEDCFTAFGNQEKRKYALTVHIGSRSRKGTIYILLYRQSSAEDIIKACFHAELLRWCYDNNGYGASMTIGFEEMTDLSKTLREEIQVLNCSGKAEGKLIHSVAQSYSIADTLFPSFVNFLRSSGWVTNYNMLGADEWRITCDLE